VQEVVYHFLYREYGWTPQYLIIYIIKLYAKYTVNEEKKHTIYILAR